MELKAIKFFIIIKFDLFLNNDSHYAHTQLSCFCMILLT